MIHTMKAPVAIDIHSHFNHGSPYDEHGHLADEIHNREMDFIKAAYDHIGIHAAGISTFGSVLHPVCTVEENQYLYELAAKEDWVYQWVVIDPRQPETYRQAEEMLKSPKTLGIKIQPVSQEYDIREYADALFSFAAEHKAFVLMHPQHIMAMPAYADRYPDMKLILAHLGSLGHVEAIAAAKHGNIYTDTSGGASNLNNIVEYAVSRIGSEKIFFGTDTYSCAFQYGRIALSILSDEDKENILYKNAMCHFPNAFQKLCSLFTAERTADNT